MKKTFKPFTARFVDKAGEAGQFVMLRKGTNFDYRISPEEAARLLLDHGYNLPFDIMCKEYGQDNREAGDNDWIGLTVEDLGEDENNPDNLLLDSDWKTLETWADSPAAAYFTPCAEPKAEEPPADPVELAGRLADYLKDCHKDNQLSDYKSLYNNPAMTEAEAMGYHKEEPEGCLYCDAIAAARAMQAKAAADCCPKCGADYDKNIVVDYNAAESMDGEERAPFTCMKCGKQGFQFRALIFDRLTDK